MDTLIRQDVWYPPWFDGVQVSPAQADYIHEWRARLDPTHDPSSCWCCCWDCDFDETNVNWDAEA